MGEQDHEPVVVAGLDLRPVRAAVRQVHLAEPGFQPAGLISVEAPGRSAGQAVRVQRDEPYRGRVVDVIRGAVQPVALAEPVPERPRAGSEMGVDEIPPADRSAEGIGRDRPRRGGHERLGPGGEQLEGLVMVEVGRQSGRFLATGQRRGQARRLGADTLVERLVIAEAGQPGQAQAGRGELPQRAPQQAGMMREAELEPEQVRSAGTRPVRPPEDLTRPVERLHTLVVRPAGIR